MTTKVDGTGHPAEILSDKQNLAIMAIISGKTDEDAAEAAGVTRQTVNGWRNSDPAFRTALKNARAVIWQKYQRTLQEALTAAIDTINDSVKAGDVKTAMWILDKIGIDDVASAVFDEMKVSPTSILAEQTAMAGGMASSIRQQARQEAYERIQAIEDRPDHDPLLFVGEREKLMQKFFGEALARLKKEVLKKAA